MTILLYKNGQWLIDGEQPLEGVSLDNLAAILTNPSDGDVIKYDEASGLWTAGKDEALPAVSSSDNGKVLAVENGAWAAADNLFVVTLSGSPLTSDKTFAEIVAAVDAGRTVVAKQGYILFQFAGYTDSAVEFVKFTANGTTVTKHAIKANGGVDSYSSVTVPAAFDADNGSELIVKNGVWAKQQKKFIVTLTPTELDYSGTMDKTVAQINEAYEAGQEIVFNVLTSATSHMMIPVANVGYSDAFDYPSFNAYLFDNNTNVMVLTFTATTNDGTKQTYGTVVYPLTRAS